MRKLRNVDYRHYICIGITLAFGALALFYFKYGYLRIFESFVDLYNSAKFYISELFELDLRGDLSINEFSKQPFEMPFNLPNTWDDFKILWVRYWELWFTAENFQSYFTRLGKILYNVSRYSLILMPVFVVIVVILNRESKVNNNYNVDSRALKAFKRFENGLYLPVKLWIVEFIRFVKENAIYAKIWAFTWAYSFNLIAIIVEAIAYYLYFIASFDLVSIYIQILKLLMDLSVMVDFVPLPIWIAVSLVVVDIIRKNIGYDRLNQNERKNCGFINDRPIVIMICGTMGKKKTTMTTDISLSEEIILRDKAFEKILETDLKFPFFPWIEFENSLKRAIENHSVYNLATCRRFAWSKKRKFEKKPCARNIFSYDFEHYPMTYDDDLKVIDIWDAIENYCQLYFVYVVESSLIIANYSIRTDNILQSEGNFPMWDNDLFKRDPEMAEAYSRHSHILDFDSLRLGKQLVEDNPRADSFEFGVVNITEIGKERGNNLELQQVKKTDDTANQKNDLFNSWLKMIRHSATIDNYPFVKVITDEQRPESWGADARDLCEIIHIDDCSEPRLSMPLFYAEDLIIEWMTDRFKGRYYKYRFERGDNTLFMYLYHGLISKLNSYRSRIYNTFGYYKLNVLVEKGTQDEEKKRCSYYLMNKKIYSKRFSTDCFSDFFNEKALRSRIGINDLAEFGSEKATFDELSQENSYFFNDLTNLKK